MSERLVKIGLGLGFLWYSVLRGARGLVVKVDSFSLRSITEDGRISFNLNVLVKNPLLVGVTVQSVVGDVYIQGINVGGVNTTYNYYLAGAKTHILPVIVDLDMRSLGQAALANIQSGNIQNLIVAFDGKVNIGRYNVGIPLQLEFTYKDLVG